MKVRIISPTEKLFKITLTSGDTKYVRVKKDTSGYQVEDTSSTENP